MLHDTINDLLTEIFEALNIDYVDAKEFDDMLVEYGFMIVPIEDPTNLRYGVED